MTARLDGSAPTSSSATPQPASRAWATPASRPAGSRATARSVTSMMTRSCDWAASTTERRSAGHGTPSDTGSVLTNRVQDGGIPAASATRYAAARQTQSSSETCSVA